MIKLVTSTFCVPSTSK